MKKILKLGLLLIIVSFSTNANCQTTSKTSENIKGDTKSAKTYLDLMINMENTNLNYGHSNNALEDYKKSVKGIQAGLSFQTGITHRFSLVSELYFMKKGGTLLANNPLSANETTLRFSTLELPILGRIHFGKFYMNAGPSISYALSGKKSINNQSSKILFNNSGSGFNRFDTGIQIGGGIEFPLKQKRIALDIRYNYGLKNISNSEEIYNRALMVSVKYSKRWKKNPLKKNR